MYVCLCIFYIFYAQGADPVCARFCLRVVALYCVAYTVKYNRKMEFTVHAESDGNCAQFCLRVVAMQGKINSESNSPQNRALRAQSDVT